MWSLLTLKKRIELLKQLFSEIRFLDFLESWKKKIMWYSFELKITTVDFINSFQLWQHRVLNRIRLLVRNKLMWTAVNPMTPRGGLCCWNIQRIYLCSVSQMVCSLIWFQKYAIAPALSIRNCVNSNRRLNLWHSFHLGPSRLKNPSCTPDMNHVDIYFFRPPNEYEYFESVRDENWKVFAWRFSICDTLKKKKSIDLTPCWLLFFILFGVIILYIN